MKARAPLATLAALLAALAILAPAAVRADELQRSALQPVFQQRSLYRNILVLDGGGYRCMAFGRYHGAQTCMQQADPERLVIAYTRGLMAAFYARPQPRRVLVIGLGGGAVSRAVRRLHPDAEIDSVELDGAVAALAGSHFGYRTDARARVIVSDGRVFVRRQRRTTVRYDVILIDAFQKDYIPEHMLTREFLGEVKTLLAPAGVVAANTFASGALERYEAATYQAVFGSLYKLDLDSGNRILLAGRDALPPLAAMQANAALLAPALGRIGVGPDELLPRLGPMASVHGVRVLTDQFSPSNLLLRY